MPKYDLGQGWTATFADDTSEPVLTLAGPDNTDQIVLDKDEMIRLRALLNSMPALNQH